MAYHLGDDASAPAPVTLESLQAQLDTIVQFQQDDARRRKWTLVIGIAGALFAAVKLGIIAAPHIRKRKLGELAPAIAKNPSRRR